MKTKAMRMYGANDIRLEKFELPKITADEVLIRVVSDSVCLSTYKAGKQGAAHKRAPNDIAENPTMPSVIPIRTSVATPSTRLCLRLHWSGAWLSAVLRR